MAEILRMIDEVVADRAWFRQQARLRRDPPIIGRITPPANALMIDAAACAIREKALRDALAAVRRERSAAPSVPLTVASGSGA